MTENSAQHGFLVGGRPEDLFKSAAAYYAAYRRPYPQPLVDFIVERCGLDGHGLLLDAGCGTGQVFQVFARWFDEVLAIDPDTDMVLCSCPTIANLGLDNVNVRQMRVEDLTAGDEGQLRMTIFGASFHWTARRRVGDAIYDLTEPGGYLAALSPSGIHSGSTDWETAIQEVLTQYLGSERRAGSGVYREGERHEEALKRTRFRGVEVADIPVCERWSIDEIVGYLYSTSYASKSVLGDRAGAFEQEVRQNLERLSSDNQFEKTIEYTVVLAQR